MNIQALIVGLVVCYNPIWATFDASKCGKSQGCFIQPPDCNNGNDFSKCSVAASFKKLNDSWMEIELLTSRIRPIGDVQIGGDTGVFVAFGLSTDQIMRDDSVMDCVYNPNANNVMGELSFNFPEGTNKPYEAGTKNQALFNQAEWSVSDNMLYCRLQRIITPNPVDSQIYDLSQSYFLFLTRGPAKKNGTRYSTGQHIISKSDTCNYPFISKAKISLMSMELVDGISGATKNPAPQDSCPSSSGHVTKFATFMFAVIILALFL